jgi:hypothetical protein
MKNTLRFRRVSNGQIVGTNGREIKKKIKSNLNADKAFKEGKYELLNFKDEVVGIVDFKIVQNGNYSGSKGKPKRKPRKRKHPHSGPKYRVIGEFKNVR